MALNTVLVLAAGLGFAGGVGQDPSLDTQILTPVLGSTQKGSPSTTSQDKVTVQFRGSKASDVLSWLENRGVNFIVAQGEVAKDATVTLNLQGVPLDNAIDSIARALGGHWEKENGIRVFKKGESPFRFFSGTDSLGKPVGGVAKPVQGQAVSGGFGGSTPPPAVVQGQAAPRAFGQGGYGYLGEDFQKRMERWSREFAQSFNAEHQRQWEKDFGPEFQRRMQKWSEEFSRKFGTEYQRQWQREFGPQFQEDMRRLGQDLRSKNNPEDARRLREEAIREGRVYRSTGDGTYRVDREELERLRKEIDQDVSRARGDAERARREAQAHAERARRDAQREAELARREGERARQEGARARAEAQKVRERALAGQGYRGAVVAPPARVQGGTTYYVRPGQRDEVRFYRDQAKFRDGEGRPALDVRRFLRNLTPDQRDRQRKRGYIWWDDLTREQKEMFGERPDGKFEIYYKINDEEIRIRGN